MISELIGKSPFSELKIASALNPQHLELIVLPTEKCNFRCTYCYEDFKIGRMRPQIVNGLKNLIKNRVADLRSLHISFFGGEPLLAKSICFEVSEFADSLAREHGVAYSGSMTTNGYLLDLDTITRLAKSRTGHFQVSLDGDAEAHNQTRVKANGQPTFEEIWKNIVAWKSSTADFAITLRVHVHRQNLASVGRLVDRLQSEILTDKRFQIFFHKVEPLGGKMPQSQLLDHISYAREVEKLVAKLGEISAKSELNLDGYICYAAKPNSLLIRADGSIGKCTVALNDPRNSIGKLNEDGTLEVSNSKFQLWLGGFRYLDPKTLACPIATMGAEDDAPTLADHSNSKPRIEHLLVA